MTDAALDASAPMRRGGVAAILLFAGLMAWAMFVPISTALVLPGTIAPAAGRQAIAPDRLARIAAVHVSDGAQVARDTPLVTLDTGLLRDERAMIALQLRDTTARLARLVAERDGTRPPVSAMQTPQAALWRARRDDHAAALRALEDRAQGLAARQKALYAAMAAQRQETELVITEQDRVAGLVDTGLAPATRLASLRLAAARADGAEAQLVARQADLDAARRALNQERARLLTTRTAELADNIAATRTERAALRLSLSALDSRMAAATLRAPVAGQIDGPVPAPGQIARPGAPLFRILPDGPRIAQALLPAARADDLRVRQAVRLRLSGRDASGDTIPARVRLIAADSHAPTRDGPEGFRVEIALPAGLDLSPGQTVTILAETARATPLALAIAPIVRALDRAAR